MTGDGLPEADRSDFADVDMVTGITAPSRQAVAGGVSSTSAMSSQCRGTRSWK